MRILTLFSLLLCTACLPISASFHIYPIGGTQTEPIPCRFKIHFGWQTATLTATLPDGESFSGSTSTHTNPPDREMAPLWDQIFGNGFFNSRVLGSPGHFRVVLKGSQGHDLKMEIHAIPGDHHGGFEGVALDNENRLYKAGY